MNDPFVTTEFVPMSTAREKAVSGKSEFHVEIVESETHGPLCQRFMDGGKVPCFLGLSPESSSLNRGRLSAILHWLMRRVSRLTIAEGSFLTRWNMRAIDGLSEVEAEGAAEERQGVAIGRINRTVQEVCGLERVEVLNWASVVRSAGFIGIRSGIDEFAGGDPSFDKALIGVVGEFLQRKRGRGVSFDLGAAQMSLLRSYVVEELAMFVHLYGDGLRTEIYPGDDLNLMRDLVAGRFSGFPYDLSGRTHIGIRLCCV